MRRSNMRGGRCVECSVETGKSASTLFCSTLSEIGNIFPERGCKIDLVILLVDKNLADLYGHGVFA